MTRVAAGFACLLAALLVGGTARAALLVYEPFDYAPGTVLDGVLATGANLWSALLLLDDSNNGNRLANVTFSDTATGDAIAFGEPAVGVGGVRISADTAPPEGSSPTAPTSRSRTARCCC